jgi:hypothetical protein
VTQKRAREELEAAVEVDFGLAAMVIAAKLATYFRTRGAPALSTARDALIAA